MGKSHKKINITEAQNLMQIAKIFVGSVDRLYPATPELWCGLFYLMACFIIAWD